MRCRAGFHRLQDEKLCMVSLPFSVLSFAPVALVQGET